MTEDRDTRCRAADMLLDIGIRIPVMPLRPFRKRPGKSFLVMRRPPAGAVIRIARRYLEFGVTPEDIRAMDYEERMRFVAEKGKAVSRMVALAVCTGWLSGMLFSGPVAWYLRWRVHPAMLSAALSELLRGRQEGPHSVFGIIAQAMERFGRSKRHILWKISYAELMLMNTDVSRYVTREELLERERKRRPDKFTTEYFQTKLGG